MSPKSVTLPLEILEDLICKFFLHLDLHSTDAAKEGVTPTLMFIFEQAQWYLIDEILPHNPALKPFADRNQFLQAMLSSEFFPPIFNKHATFEAVDKLWKNFGQHKHTIPCAGAIMLDPEMEHVLLQRGVKQSGSWSLPRGKKEPHETLARCCSREVYEESSLKISHLLREEHTLKCNARGGKEITMYIVTGVPRSVHLQPRTKGEVGGYAWVPLNRLPRNPAESNNTMMEGKTWKFFDVFQFVAPLRKWVAAERKAGRVGVIADLQPRPDAAGEAPPVVLTPAAPEHPRVMGTAAGVWPGFVFDRLAIEQAMHLAVMHARSLTTAAI